MCFATARFSQGDSIMKSLCETLYCFCKSTFVSNYFNHMFSSGKASSGTNAGRVPLRKRLPAVAMKGNAQQEWSAFLGAPSSPFERLTSSNRPSSLWQGPCLCLLYSLPDGLLLLLRGHHHPPPPTPHSSNPHCFCQLFLQTNLPCCFCSSLDHKLILFTGYFSFFSRV